MRDDILNKKSSRKVKVSDLKDMIGRDEIQNTITELKKIIIMNMDDNLFLNEVIIHESKYHSLKKLRNSITSSKAEIAIEESKLKSHILEFIDELYPTIEIQANKKAYIDNKLHNKIAKIINKKLSTVDIKFSSRKVIIIDSFISPELKFQEKLHPLKDAECFLCFWLKMKRSTKKLIVYAPENIEIKTLARDLAFIILPHLIEIDYTWNLVKEMEDGKKINIPGWSNLKTSDIYNGDIIFLIGTFNSSDENPNPPEGYPQSVDPAMLSKRYK